MANDNLSWSLTSSVEENTAQGSKGEQGPPGPPGPSVADSVEWANVTNKPLSYPSTSYNHQQIAPSAIWTVIHNLGKYPSVTIADSGGNTVVGDVKHESLNKVVISFTAAFAGKAFLN